MPERYLTLYFDSAIITKMHLLALVAGECYHIKIITTRMNRL
jgi:hypothetical protein